MEKAKNIITSRKFTKAILWLAGVLAIIAVLVVLFFGKSVKRAYKERFNPDPEPYLVQNGDVWGNMLPKHGGTIADGNDIHKLLADSGKKGLVSCEKHDSKCDRIQFWPLDAEGKLNKIVLTETLWKKYELLRDKETGKWVCNTVNIDKDTRVVLRSGKIIDGSFYLDAMRAGISERIVMTAYSLLAFDVDFERDIRAGQEFFVLYEENYVDGERVNEKEDTGKILAVSLEALRGNVKMYRFEKSNGDAGFYDEKGNGATKSLKRTPINNAKVTSNFSTRRKHPVLGFTRAHKGVDFRAPTGTPIPAAGAGTVVARSFNRGHGNFVKIRHNKSFETLYAHMSRFQKGVNVGTHVKQGQIIGYAGSTGLSTGPHLHYEIIKNGVHVNPLTVVLPPIDNLNNAQKARFLEYRPKLDALIEELKSGKTSYVSKTVVDGYLPQ